MATDSYNQKRIVFFVLLLGMVIGCMVLLRQKIDQMTVEKDRPATGETAQVKVETPFVPEPYDYQSKPASRDGSGKVYMGREISLVMGHEGIDWLERASRKNEENPDRAVQGLELKPDAVVADIGSGSGYYSFLIAPLVPKGKVIGVDIQPEMVAFLYQKSQELGVTNVESHLGKIDNVQLAANSIDAAIMVDAYHEFSHPNEMMQSIYHALREGGRVYLLEYRAEDPEVPIKALHKMSQAQSIKEMQAVGLKHVRTDDFLPWQHFMVFEK
ncbi:methyltransferase type 11 [Oceaniferula spumae]|uniref:Methyltransferase type 11 n=1 Tax=Oceaniferula spumae TaxID=2979115 RepID=A0AAT9FNK9_9BACT